MTGIVDLEAGRCFVMELNRSRVMPPRNLFDMIEKMKSGYYDIDTEVIHETYRVVTPPLPNGYLGLGSYINEECASFPIYRLERMTSPGQLTCSQTVPSFQAVIPNLQFAFSSSVYKRSAGSPDEKSRFMEFAGNKVSQMDIMGLESAPGTK